MTDGSSLPGAVGVYPDGWEADVVLRDGRTARIRPIRPDDAFGLRAFHAQLSEQTIYFRFFAPHPELSDSEVARFTSVDHCNRVALVVTMRGHLVGVGRYDRLDSDSAEVAFVISDDHQGLGLGSLLLEHLAAAARENGITRFTADVLPANSRMLATFRYAGYEISQGYDEGVITVSLGIEPTQFSKDVQDAREQRSESRSLVPLLRPRSVAIVGASRRSGTVGHALLRNLVTCGFMGRIHVIHPTAEQIFGVPCLRTLSDLANSDDQGSGVDLVIIAVPADDVPHVVDEATAIGARALIVVSSGFERSDSTSRLARQAREAGMRLLGPAALGAVNTDDGISLNASLLPVMPGRGGIGFFCQSGALALDIMQRMSMRGLGVSYFVSAGHRADVSGNDLLQYWEEDERTHSVMMYLETVGNPRKFARLVERTCRHKPVVVLRTTGARSSIRGPIDPGAPRPDELPPQAFDQILADTGVIEVTSLDQLLDVAEILQIRGTIGRGRIGLVGNSEAVEILARNAAVQQGLECVTPSRILARASSPHRFRRYLDDTVRDPDVDIVVALYVPPVESVDDVRSRALIAELAGTVSKPVIAVVLGWNAQELRESVNARPGVVLPTFTDVEHAMAAIGHVVRYSHRVKQADQPGASMHIPPASDTLLARKLVDDYVEQHDVDHGRELAIMANEHARELLESYSLPPFDAASTMSDVGAVRVIATRDPLLGPVVSFGLDGPVADALGDRHYALAPLTLQQAQALVSRSVVSTVAIPATGLSGHGVDDGDQAAQIIRRAASLVHDLARVHRVEIVCARHPDTMVWMTRSVSVQISSGSADRLWGTRSLNPLTGNGHSSS